MNVTSYLELFLTLFGWTLYTEIWTIFLETGLVYLPFIGMFIKNISMPVRSQEAKDAASTSLRRIEIDIIAMLTVVVLACQPFMTLGFNNLNYTIACSANPSTVHTGATGTTYDAVFTAASLGGNSVKVPIWWYAVLALSGGFNDAMILSIPCNADIRLTRYGLVNSRIKDPQLRRQVQLFFNDCYHPAMTAFLDKKMVYPAHLPKDDLYWLGSQFFVNHLYDGRNRASTEIPGFRYNANRDTEYNPAIYVPRDGKPTCKQWWTGQGHVNNRGLRSALLNQITPSSLTQAQQTLGSLTGKTPTEIEDIALKTLINRERGHFNGLKDLSSYNNNSAHLLRDIASAAGSGVGSFLEALTFYPKMYMVKMAAPVIQAMILMMIYLLLPFVMLFSSYDIGRMVFMAIVIFAVKFWSVLWAVAHWLDNHLIQALAPKTWMLFDRPDSVLEEMIVQFTIGVMFIVLPLFWSGVLTWAGYRVGHEINGVVKDTREPSASAGQSGGKAAHSIGSKVTKI